MGAKVLAFGFWLWAALMAVGAGYFRSILNCEYQSCEDGSPSWVEPWAWGDYYVYPEVSFVGLVGLVAASLFVVCLLKDRRPHAAIALLVSLILMTYPYFAGFEAVGARGLDTIEARMVFSLGPLLGLGVIVLMRRGQRRLSSRPG